MTDYIDRDAALTLDFRIQTRLFERRIETAKRAVEAYAVKIAAIPIADVAPVVRGKWEMWDDGEGDTWECSACGEVWVLNAGTPMENNMNYCPNCGAKMEAEP